MSLTLSVLCCDIFSDDCQCFMSVQFCQKIHGSIDQETQRLVSHDCILIFASTTVLLLSRELYRLPTQYHDRLNVNARLLLRRWLFPCLSPHDSPTSSTEEIVVQFFHYIFSGHETLFVLINTGKSFLGDQSLLPSVITSSEVMIEFHWNYLGNRKRDRKTIVIIVVFVVDLSWEGTAFHSEYTPRLKVLMLQVYFSFSFSCFSSCLCFVSTSRSMTTKGKSTTKTRWR